jgi:hypothetical protein
MIDWLIRGLVVRGGWVMVASSAGGEKKYVGSIEEDEWV